MRYCFGSPPEAAEGPIQTGHDVYVIFSAGSSLYKNNRGGFTLNYTFYSPEDNNGPTLGELYISSFHPGLTHYRPLVPNS